MPSDMILEKYVELLDVYSQQVKSLEDRKKEVDKKQPNSGGVPYMMLNSRIFIQDEYLTNPFHRGFCYEEKNRIMPHLVSFLATYEKCTAEDRAEFENLKPKGQYQQYLDELIKGKEPFLEFLESQLKDLNAKENRVQVPFPPRRRNATRQLADYREAKRKYEEEMASIKRCREEVIDRKELFKKLLENQ